MMNNATDTRLDRVRYYRTVCQKGDGENYLFDKIVFRRVSIYPTIGLIKLGVRPNQATFLSAVALVASYGFLASNKPALMLVGALLVFVYYTLDHVDGELARYYVSSGKMTPSLNGLYFDELLHSYSTNIMMFALGYSVYTEFEYHWALVGGFLACIGASTFPNLVAARVLVQKVFNDPGSVSNPEAQMALRRIERKGLQLEAMRARVIDLAKLRKVAEEFFGFPGVLILIMVVVSVDASVGSFAVHGVKFNGRLLLVAWMAFLHTLKTLIFFRSWMSLLRPIR